MKAKIWTMVGVVYMCTFYALGVVLIRIGRFVLAIGYLLALERRKANDTIKRVLKW